MNALRDGVARAGMVLAGKYRLLVHIAEGGMGTVWRAEDLRLGSPVAVKLIHQKDVNDAEILARFEAEAEIAAQLRSPHVVQVFDAGVDRQSGMPFIAMELLEGESLRDRLARCGALSASAVVEIISQVARALARAHELGIVHRDLKPANVFLLRDGDRDVVKVLDFGIAKRTQGVRAGPTVTGDLLGTPTYMSPEQILSSKEVDYRTDLWSLAVIATECLTGALPFDCDNLPGLALAICHGQATPPSRLGRVPAGFDAWFHRATQLRPGERFASAAAMAKELRRTCLEERPPAGAAVDREQDTPKHSAGAEARVSPSVGPTTTTVPRQVAPLRRQRQRQRQRRLALLTAVAILLLVATCTALREQDSEPTIADAAMAQQHPEAESPADEASAEQAPRAAGAATPSAGGSTGGAASGAAGGGGGQGRAGGERVEGAGISIVRDPTKAQLAARSVSGAPQQGAPARPTARPRTARQRTPVPSTPRPPAPAGDVSDLGI